MADKTSSNRNKLISAISTREPNEEIVQNLASIIGIYKHSCESDDLAHQKCIRCGKCVKTCRDVVGVNALAIYNASDKKKKDVAPVTFETAYKCIGCGSCAYICPVKCIDMEDNDGNRTIHRWKVNFKLKSCKVCRKFFAPEAQLDYIIDRAGLTENFFDTCNDCK